MFSKDVTSLALQSQSEIPQPMGQRCLPPRRLASPRATLAENSDNFLKLLMVRLKNLDPTSSLDTNQFPTQLVQFSGVEQLISANTNLTKLIDLTQGAGTIGLVYGGQVRGRARRSHSAAGRHQAGKFHRTERPPGGECDLNGCGDKTRYAAIAANTVTINLCGTTKLILGSSCRM